MGGRASAVRAAAAAVHAAGLAAPLSRLAGHAGPASFPILVYHRVNDDGDAFFPALPTAVFARQVAFLARAYRVMTVEALAAALAAGAVPRNAAAITFDDGYRDNLTHAAPILARHGMPATVFLATGFIGTGEVPWVDRLALAFKTTGAETVRLAGGEPMSLAGVAARRRALDRALTGLKGMDDDARREAVGALVETLGGASAGVLKGLMLDWEDVRALARQGVAIGAHTVRHPILSRVSAERAREEITGSRAAIRAATGTAPAAFAYPNGQPGDYTAATVGLVREAGFACAVTTRFGVNRAGTSPWELRRGGPWEPDLPTFALKLAWYRLADA